MGLSSRLFILIATTTAAVFFVSGTILAADALIEGLSKGSSQGGSQAAGPSSGKASGQSSKNSGNLLEGASEAASSTFRTTPDVNIIHNSNHVYRDPGSGSEGEAQRAGGEERPADGDGTVENLSCPTGVIQRVRPGATKRKDFKEGRVDFIRSNMLKLEVETVKGKGPNLDTLASMYFCKKDDIPKLRKIMKKYYYHLFPDRVEADALDQNIGLLIFTKKCELTTCFD